MNGFERLMREVNIFIDNSLDFLDNSTFRMIIILFLVIYSTVIIPILDSNLNKIFNNTVVKLILFLIIIYIGTKDPVIALLIVCSYLLSLLQLNNNTDETPILSQIEDSETNETNHSENNQIENDVKQIGSNEDNQDCLNQCTRTGNTGKDDLGDQCTPISSFNNELNAQGFNCPLGSDNISFGSPF